MANFYYNNIYESPTRSRCATVVICCITVLCSDKRIASGKRSAPSDVLYSLISRSMFAFCCQRSAQYLHKELPVRIAHRIDGFRQLPFIVGCNPTILSVVSIRHPTILSFVSTRHPTILSVVSTRNPTILNVVDKMSLNIAEIFVCTLGDPYWTFFFNARGFCHCQEY